MGKITRLTDEEKYNITRLRQQGLSLSKIAAQTGRSTSRIGSICNPDTKMGGSQKKRKPGRPLGSVNSVKLEKTQPATKVIRRPKYENRGPKEIREEIVEQVTTHQKPMIALIGTVSEVTQTLKGVFS